MLVRSFANNGADGHKLFEESMAAGAPASALVSELNDEKLHHSFVEKIANREKSIQLRRQKLYFEFAKATTEEELLQIPEPAMKDKATDAALVRELKQVGLHSSFVEQLAHRSQSIKLRRQQLSLQRHLRELRKDKHVTAYLKLRSKLRKLRLQQHADALGTKKQPKGGPATKLALTQVMMSSKKEDAKKLQKELRTDREVKKEDGLNIQPPSQSEKSCAAHLHGKHQSLVASIASSMVLIVVCSKWQHS